MSQWIWRAFVQSALIPLVLVETVLIAIYLLSNSAIRDAQVDYLRQTALEDLQASARLETRIVDGQLTQIEALTNTYRNLTQRALQQPAGAPPELAVTPSGVRYSAADNGGAAFFYSAVTPLARQDLGKAAQLVTLEPLMAELKQSSPLVASLYFNSWDSLNHIYPWFLTPDQYPHDMVIPDYNFYYQADAAHNPQRKVVWTDVYLDPAGQGWMMSAIAPVYRGDFLEGVSGVDITVGGILSQIDQLQVPWDGYAMLVSQDLNIMALPKTGEDDFGLDELTEHSYAEAIRREIFKPEDFNLSKREQTRSLAAAMAQRSQGVQSVMLGGRPHLLAWATIERTGWKLLAVVDEAQVFSQTNFLARHYQQIGYLLIAGLVLFYLLFFAFMWMRSRRLSQYLLKPIAGISTMMAAIGQGQWRPTRVSADIRELDDMAGQAAQMGSTLEQSEVRNQAAQQRLEVVLEGATESLWERHFDTGLVHVRGRFCKRFGFSQEVFSEDAFLQRVHPDDARRVRDAVQQVREGTSQHYEAEFRFADAEGRYAWLMGRGRVVEHDPQTGRALVLAGTHVDIDALKNGEQALRHATEEAQAANQAKSRFISSMSHELRTPLNAIQGFAQLMRMERPASGAEGLDYLDEILTASEHLNQLVGDILEWSSVQADKARVELGPVTVHNLLNECAELVRVEVDKQGLTLNLDLPDAALQVIADPLRLRQVMLNLLSNAIKYNQPAGQITLSYQVAAGHVRLLVEDTGLGISPELQDQVFEPFERVGRQNTAIQGTGLGLALCQQFATLMNGRMGLHSEPGIGSSFWIELPLAGAVAAPTPAAAGARPRVFYVEDNPASQFVVRKALEDLADIEVVSDGRVAVERLLASPPALLLLDYHLPGLNGEQVLRQLRAAPQTHDLPVVVLSAAADTAKLLSLDCQGFLAKPLDLDELRGLVSALLQEVNKDAV
nr:ATP-binding protein [Pseudomonas peli]